jgi:DNA-binding FadR family transcriptional regulator
VAAEVLALRDLRAGLLLVDDIVRFHLRQMEDVASLAAERHGASDMNALEFSYFELQRAIGWQDDLLIEKKEAELTEALVCAAASRALRLSLSGFRRLCEGLELRRPPFAPWNALATWRSLIETVRARRSDTARVLIREMLNRIYPAVRSAYLRRYPPADLVSTARPAPDSEPAGHIEAVDDPGLPTP